MEKNKRIAIFFSSFHIGGVERVMILLANHLWSLGYEVSVIVAKEEGDLRSSLTGDIRVHSLGNVKLRSSLRPLIRCLNLVAPDYMITGPDFVNLIALIANVMRKNRTKVIISQHCFFDIEIKRLGLHGKLIPWMIKLLYPQAYRMIAVSNGIKDMLLDYGLPDRKIVRIYNPIDVEDITNRAREENHLELPENYIVFVGRLSFVKNLSLLLKAFNLLRKRKPFSLVIVGEGAEKDKLISLSYEFGIEKEVIFCGSLSNPFPVLAKACLLVLPSFSESFGNVIIEAMALGITSVATPTIGVKEISEDGKFVYLSNNFSDENSFAQLLEYACEHPMDASALCQKALEFDIKRIMGLYLDLIKSSY